MLEEEQERTTRGSESSDHRKEHNYLGQHILGLSLTTTLYAENIAYFLIYFLDWLLSNKAL